MLLSTVFSSSAGSLLHSLSKLSILINSIYCCQVHALRDLYEAIELLKACSFSPGLNLRLDFGAAFTELAGRKRKIRNLSWKLLPRKLVLNSIFGQIQDREYQISRKTISLEKILSQVCGISCLFFIKAQITSKHHVHIHTTVWAKR